MPDDRALIEESDIGQNTRSRLLPLPGQRHTHTDDVHSDRDSTDQTGEILGNHVVRESTGRHSAICANLASPGTVVLVLACIECYVGRVARINRVGTGNGDESHLLRHGFRRWVRKRTRDLRAIDVAICDPVRACRGRDADRWGYLRLCDAYLVAGSIGANLQHPAYIAIGRIRGIEDAHRKRWVCNVAPRLRTVRRTIRQERKRVAAKSRSNLRVTDVETSIGP